MNIRPFSSFLSVRNSLPLRKSFEPVMSRGIHTSSVPISLKRVFGVIAHINSGKTTTSEAMLYTSGALPRMGNVDIGDTTMDFLPAERERGITITAAAICFTWRRHQLFLVDSPGHLDFTFEVERSLRVMDAAVVLLDAVAGVQPQTETVWRQADAYSLPRLIFINKMDREGADFNRTITNIRQIFNAVPVVTHLPIFDESHRFVGVFNLLERFPSSAPNSECTLFENSADNDGHQLSYENLSNIQIDQIDLAVDQIVEACADVDDDIMTAWINEDTIQRETIQDAIRTACVQQALVPVMCGASLREIGVRSLMDSVVSFLPSPMDKTSSIAAETSDVAKKPTSVSDCISAPFLAYAFKVTHEKHRGRMVHLRVLSGRLDKRCLFINTTNGKKEQPVRFLRILADKYEDIESVDNGDIFAAVRFNARDITEMFHSAIIIMYTNIHKLLVHLNAVAPGWAEEHNNRSHIDAI